MLGVVDLSQEGKVSTVDASPEAIEKLMTKIENESRSAATEQEKLQTEKVNKDAEKSTTSVSSSPPLSNAEPATPSSCEKKPTVAATKDKSSNKSQSSIKSKENSECDSSSKTSNKETAVPTAVSDSPVEAADPATPIVSEKGENDCKVDTTSVSSSTPAEIGGGGDQAQVTAPTISQPSIVSPADETTPKAAPKPVNPAAASDVANKVALPRSDSKPEIVGSVLKVGLSCEKNASIQSDSKETVSSPSGVAINMCDKTDAKPIPEQKKKVSRCFSPITVSIFNNFMW